MTTLCCCTLSTVSLVIILYNVTTDFDTLALKTERGSSTNRDKSVSEDTTATPALEAFPSEPVSIPAFIRVVQHPPPRSKQLVVTSIEWRTTPSGELNHAYAVINASTSIQSEPTVAIRVDR